MSVFTDTFSETIEREVEVSDSGEGVVETFSSTLDVSTLGVIKGSTEFFSVVSIIESIVVLDASKSELSVTSSCGVVESVIEAWVVELD